MTIVTFVLAAGCTIFVLISLLIPIAAAVRLPLPVLIAAVGLTAGALTWLTGFELAGKAPDAYDLWFVKSLALDTNSLLLIFLPPLLFEMSLGVSPRRLRDDVWIVLVMAVVAVVLATIFVGLAVASVSNVSLIACLLLGAAISTTDPAAVVTTFREIGAPRRLVVILEGESLLNDAAAIALFTLLVAVARADATAGPINLLASFGYSFGAGTMAGAAIALFASRIFPLLGASVVAEATLTVALAHGSYLLAEIGLGASGVVAVVFAGMTTRHFGVVAMGPRNWSTVMAVWTQIGFWANALILLLAAAMAPRMLASLKPSETLLIGVAFVAAFAARALILFGFLPLLTRLRMTTRIGLAQKTLVWWGGVRGAVTLVLALSIAELTALSGEEGRIVAAIGAGFVFATLLLNASTLALATRLLGLNTLSPEDQALKARIIASTREEIREFVEGLASERAIEPEALIEMRQTYESETADALKRATSIELDFGERLRLGLKIICNQELRLVQKAFEDGSIGPRVTRLLRANAENLADAARHGGRMAYEMTTAAVLDPTRSFRRPLIAHRYLGSDRPLRDQLRYRLNVLLETDVILRDLLRFSATALPRAIGADASANLANVLEERAESTRRHIEAIALQYPKYTTDMERILLLRAAARRERAHYDDLLDDGILTTEVHKSLVQELDRRMTRLDRPPQLDLGLTAVELVSEVSLFEALDETLKRAVAELMRPRIVMPNEVVVARGERGGAMYFIASGVIEVQGQEEAVLLSNGDFFGEVSLLAPTRRRTTDLTAVSVCRLLVLTRKDFRALLARYPDVESIIRRAAERQLGEGFRHRPVEEIEAMRSPRRTRTTSADGDSAA